MLNFSWLDCHNLWKWHQKVAASHTVDTFEQNVIRDEPLEKLWGGEGNFRAAGIFFR